MDTKKEKKNILSNGAVQTLLASLFCIILGLVVGYVVLLVINPQGAGRATVHTQQSLRRRDGLSLEAETPSGAVRATRRPSRKASREEPWPPAWHRRAREWPVMLINLF